MKDVTNEWREVPAENANKVKDLNEYEINGHIYKVDNRQVVLDYSRTEETMTVPDKS